MTENKKKRKKKKKGRKKTLSYGRKVTPEKLIKAIKGTGGVKTRIAENLGVSRACVNRYLLGDLGEGEDWEAARQAWEDEYEAVGDQAERTIIDMIEQREELPVAERAARWYLEKRRGGTFGKQPEQVVISGGKDPIQVEQKNLINLEALTLPLVVRKALLKAIEDQDEAEENGDDE